MSTTDTTPTVYAGDQYPEQINRHSAKVVYAALAATRPLTLQGTYDKVNAVLAVTPDDPSAEYSAALVETLLAVEAELHGSDNDGSAAHVGVQYALRATGRRLVGDDADREWRTYDIWFIATDETEYWEIPDQYKAAITRIEEVQYLDRNRRVHLCEFTPSHELYHFETRAVFADDVDDDLRDEIDNWIRGEDGSNDVEYNHCHDVSVLIERNEPGTVYHWGNASIDLNDLRDDVLDKLGREVNAKRRAAGKPLRSNVEVERQFADGLDEQLYSEVMDRVREAVQGNPVL